MRGTKTGMFTMAIDSHFVFSYAYAFNPYIFCGLLGCNDIYFWCFQPFIDICLVFCSDKMVLLFFCIQMLTGCVF